MSFLILSLPRSRSYWLSRYLSYPPHRCGHDIILECDSLSNLIRTFTTLSGSVELSIGLAWQCFMNLFPEVKIITVRRPVDEVFNSLRQVGVYTPIEQIQMRDTALAACSKHPRVNSIEYSDLSNPECCEWLFEHCLDLPWDINWYRNLDSQNLQVEIHQRVAMNNKRSHIMQKILLEAISINPELKEYHAG